MALIRLASPADTERLGAWLASHLPAANVPAILLRGPLGCGKTTLASAITRHLPGGDHAEISSPSFTICNEYPTRPVVLHCDLYRCKADIPEELLDALDDNSILALVEWAELMAKDDLPRDYVEISFNVTPSCRLLSISPRGKKADTLVAALARDWRDGPDSDA